eukprot:TRINITY_DN15881_c0_g1_i2.p1 TRINITY_DN15881_c0_g1~~TRINITY_DN15881_c0_g1_i2.p1  ORF type:complete len:680 (-),score=222.76 TRINITY_DN15881_c0_g1_i2:60-2099(-)
MREGVRAIYRSLGARVESLTEAESQGIGFDLILTDIHKDVRRTDRTHAYFAGEHNPSLAVLAQILAAHALCNPGLGYAQGMSDLLSVLLYIVQEQAEAYWCFATLMTRMDSLFSAAGVSAELAQVQQRLCAYDPVLGAHIEAVGAQSLPFCYSWVPTLLKREAGFAQAPRLWEALWSEHMPDMLQCVCVWLLCEHRGTALQCTAEGMMQHFASLPGPLDLHAALLGAQRVHHEVRAFAELHSFSCSLCTQPVPASLACDAASLAVLAPGMVLRSMQLNGQARVLEAWQALCWVQRSMEGVQGSTEAVARLLARAMASWGSQCAKQAAQVQQGQAWLHGLCAQHEWQHVHAGAGIEARAVCEGSTVTCIVEGVVHAPVLQVLAMPCEVECWPRWYPQLQHAAVLSQPSRTHTVLCATVQMPWPLSPREVMLSSHGFDTLEHDGSFLILASSVQGHPQPHAEPAQMRAVHQLTPLGQAGTLVRAGAVVELCLLTCPPWMLSFAAKSIAHRLVQALREGTAANFGRSSQAAAVAQDSTGLYAAAAPRIQQPLRRLQVLAQQGHGEQPCWGELGFQEALTAGRLLAHTLLHEPAVHEQTLAGRERWIVLQSVQRWRVRAVVLDEAALEVVEQECAWLLEMASEQEQEELSSLTDSTGGQEEQEEEEADDLSSLTSDQDQQDEP